MTAALDTALRPTASNAAAQQGRFGQLITHGTFYSAGTQLSNVAVVLPFLCAGRGMAWLAALLYPAYCIGKAVGNAASPCILHWSRGQRHLVVAGTVAAMAVLVSATAAVSTTGGTMPIALLLTSALLGLGSGLSNVAFNDIASGQLSDARRGDLLLGQSAAGSLLAAAVTLLVVPALIHGDAATQGMSLLWFGAAGLAAAGIAAVFVGPVRVPPTAIRQTLRSSMGDGVRAARSQPWFHRYALTQLVFVPVSLGSTFYSLRAAQGQDNLPVLIVVSSAALLVGSALWRAVYRAFGVRGMLVGSAAMSLTAAAGCLTAELLGLWSSGWVLAAVFLLATMANQAVYAASMNWVSLLAESCDRAALLGLGSAFIAVATCAIGAVVGDLALDHADALPVVLMLGLSVVALVIARNAPSANVVDRA
ncbi:MFS transporter [[Mycobacterium] wendilense]|uniref:MFS transporter n=1 Tax=[Mycobacterium] wendilense TaxID=3064284 RepID=A0ABM9M864_9MYCO|nr:MFS transporter [Mycolicibacterium sp. MU0050]CAJ1578691.1 MFS transporter [Mycolicibacterium sp. MU0050]